jgi:hypothetical protein
MSLALKTEIADKYVAPILSHCKHNNSLILIPSSLRRILTHITSAEAFAKDFTQAL